MSGLSPLRAAPLRHATPGLLKQDAHVFPVKEALRYVERSRLGGRSGRGSQGATYYAARNPPFGAVFTYYLKDKLKTRRENREEAEKKATDAQGDLVTSTGEFTKISEVLVPQL